MIRSHILNIWNPTSVLFLLTLATHQTISANIRCCPGQPPLFFLQNIINYQFDINAPILYFSKTILKPNIYYTIKTLIVKQEKFIIIYPSLSVKKTKLYYTYHLFEEILFKEVLVK